MQTKTLIQTKLQPPAIGPAILLRPHLIERLENGRYHKLTLISAPAGYGKSILAGIWREACACSAAWLSLDKNDNDLAVFLSYFIAAVQTIFPDACARTEALLNAHKTPPLDYLTTTLINETAVLPAPFVIALDDYHFITQPAIHNLVSALVQYQSEQMHLMIITRQDPLLGLPTLRANNQITEIRTDDLCFTQEETRNFLENALGERCSEKLAATLTVRTEGWPAGLRLAYLALRDEGEESVILDDFNGTNQYVMSYLLDEALARQPRAIQRFLMETAVLDRLCIPLCDALQCDTADPDQVMSSQEIIDYLIQNNLFIIPLDQQGQWFRYHHLFQELLAHKLKTEVAPPRIAALHTAASGWLEQNGFVEEAINHALTADDMEQATRLMANHRHQMMDREQWQRLQRWLDRMPRQLVEQRAHLLFIEAWLGAISFRLKDVAVVLQKISSLLESGDPTLSDEEQSVLSSEVNTLMSVINYWMSQGQLSLESAQQALCVTPFTHRFVRAVAQSYEISAFHLTGQADKAYQVLHKVLDEDKQYSPAFYPRIYSALMMIEILSGDLHGAEQTLHQIVRLAKTRKQNEELGWALETLGYIYYQWNDLETAEDYFLQVMALRYQCNAQAYAQSLFNLAQVYQATGQLERAHETSIAAIEWVREVGNAQMALEAQSLTARLVLMKGQTPKVSKWAVPLGDTIPMMLMIEIPHLTLAWALIAQNTPDSWQQAADLLHNLHEAATTTQNSLRLAEVLLLEALLLDSQGKLETALVQLETAVSLSESGGFIRRFVDMGAPMAKLLAALPGREKRPYLQKLLAAFDQSLIQPAANSSAQPLIDPLTEREMEVLQLLAQRQTNQEIAQQLIISPHTVNDHLKNIYSKLSVHGRRQAAKRAQELGIIP